MKPHLKQDSPDYPKSRIRMTGPSFKKKHTQKQNAKMLFAKRILKKNRNFDDYAYMKFHSCKKSLGVRESLHESPTLRFCPETSTSDEESEEEFEFSVREDSDASGGMEVSSEAVDEDSDIDDPTPINLKVTPARKSGCLIITVQHPRSFVISGTATIEVIAGAVDVLGYELNVFKKQNAVYSFPDHGKLQMRTKVSECEDVECIKKRLMVYASKEQMTSVLESYNESSVLLVIGKNMKASALHFACSYIPKVLKFPDSKDIIFPNFQFAIESNRSPIHVSKALKHAAEKIEHSVRTFAKYGGCPPRFLVYGNKGRGKSTSLRYFINRVLSLPMKKVLYLDADPGQPEFTIPGCVSLTEITRPLLGPSFTHQKTPLKCKFFGGLSLESSNWYFSHLNEVLEYYQSQFPDEILFINTAGWTKGLGLAALDQIRKSLVPLTEVELTEKSIGMRSKRISDSSNNNSPHPLVKLTVPGFTSELSKIPPAVRRSLSILTYFGRLQPFYENLKTLNAFKPYSVRYLESVAIHIIDCDVSDNQKINIINASIVALCQVDKSEILPCIDGTVPNRLAPESNYGECIGFGFVRGVNITKKVLYILTPISQVQLRRVNALIKGDVQMPNEVFTMQKLPPNTPVPYVAEMSQPAPLLEKKVKRRTFREK